MSPPASGQVQASQEFEAAITQAKATVQQGTVPNGDLEVNQTIAKAAQPTQTAPVVEPPTVQPVKIGEEEYTPDQLAELVQKGKTAKEWESQRPGYNLDSLYADYTQKTMELAELKKQESLHVQEPQIQLAPEEQIYLQKAVNPIIETAFQKERDRQAIESFKKMHSEYNDLVKWNDYSSFFNSYYKLPTEVSAQLSVMEMAHQNKNFDSEVKKKAEQAKGQALTDIQKLEMASAGGGVQKTQPGPHDNLTPEQLNYMKAFGVL